MSEKKFYSMLGQRPKEYLDRAENQRLQLSKIFSECIRKVDDLYGADFDESTGVLKSVYSPVGILHVEYFLIPDIGQGVRYFCVFYDFTDSSSGRVRRDVYSLTLNTEGAWSDSTGKDIKFDFYSGTHGNHAFNDIFTRIIESHLGLNDARSENFLKCLSSRA